jgi:hypothetical protein
MPTDLPARSKERNGSSHYACFDVLAGKFIIKRQKLVATYHHC